MAIASIATCWSMRGGDAPRRVRPLPSQESPNVVTTRTERPDHVEAPTDDEPHVIDRTPAPPEVEVEQEYRTHGVMVFVSELMKARDPWHLGDWYDKKSGVRTKVSREIAPDGSLRIGIADHDGYTGSVLEIELEPVQGAAPRAKVSVTYSRDTGPQFQDRWKDVSGRIRINANDWNKKDPFVVEWDLHGIAFGERVCDHGAVELGR
jgi:hypothetical protein